MLYIIKIERKTMFNNTPYDVYIDEDNSLTEDINKAKRFTFNQKEEYIKHNDLNDIVYVMAVDERKYRIKYDNHYVKECDLEYLVECTKDESIFSEDFAKALYKQQPNRIKLEEIL